MLWKVRHLCLHLSTQAGVCNALGAKYAKELGFSRVILARETRLADIVEIAKIIETEAFVQGALCTCFSGQCYLSSFAGGNSGNRGKCKQPCRKRYKIDRAGFDEYAYRISLSDLCVGEDIQKLTEAGVSSFKIEGRMRRPEYVASAVAYYRALIDGKKAEAENKPFYRWPESVHQEPEQRKRLRQAQAENFQVEAVGKNGRKICRMKAASDPDFYFVALGICQCPEFKATHKPCKHIYKIALNKGLIQAAPEGEA